MRTLKWLAVVAFLLLPASSFALGVTASAGGGGIIQKDNNAARAAVEVTVFHEFFDVLRLELPIEYQILPETPDFSVRPGIKAFIPIVGLYARAGGGMANVLGKSTKGYDRTWCAVGGIGWQLALLDTVGIFVEGSYEYRVKPVAHVPMGRLGVVLDLD